MNKLPQPDDLARMVSNVTTTLLGITFHPVLGTALPMDRAWKTALLPIPGKRPITVGLASDHDSCSALSAAMFSCPREQVDATMMDDSLRELVNMTAGLVKSALAPDQALGLPRIFPHSSLPARGSGPDSQSVLLKADHLRLLLWVVEGELKQEELVPCPA
jgi:hypothetical protein